MKKICSICKIVEDVSGFYRKSASPDGYSPHCKTCCKKYDIVHKEEISNRKSNYYQDNKKHINKRNNLWYYDNVEKCAKKAHKRYLKNTNRIITKYVIYRRNRIRTDSTFRLENTIRKRINCALKGKAKATEHTLQLIGCSIEQFKKHLQRTAIKNGYKNFDINNYSGKEYHIDHIIPCSAFYLDCSYHQKLCFNWKNQQILTAKENLTKSYNFAN